LSDVFDLNEGKFACVEYQMNWPGTGDTYYTTEGGVRKTYYSVSGIPDMAVDGIYYIGSPTYYTSEFLNTEYVVPSFINLSSTLGFNGLNTFTAKVTINPLLTFSGTNKLYVALVEKLTTKNIKTNNEEEFEYVFKKFMTSANGQAIALTKDSIKEINLSYIFNGSYRLPTDGQTANIINNSIENSVEEMTDIMLVYWIQDNTTKEVLQSGTAQQVLSINEFKSHNVKVSVYPNPSEEMVNVVSNQEFTNVKLVNVLGQVIYNVNITANDYAINTTQFQPGLYIVQLETKNGIVNRKISIK
jgi:hypothetical protein